MKGRREAFSSATLTDTGQGGGDRALVSVFGPNATSWCAGSDPRSAGYAAPVASSLEGRGLTCLRDTRYR